MPEPKASERDKEHFRKIGEALNPPIKPITQAERMRQMNFGAYVEWLQGAREFMIALKGKLSPCRYDGIENGHARAIRLGLLKYGKNT